MKVLSSSSRVNRIALSLLAVFCFGTGLGVEQAWGTDFTLKVPYDIKNIQPDVSKFKIYCWVHGASPSGGGSVPQIGFKSADLNVSGKTTLKGVANVKLNASSGKDPNLARSYSCDLRAVVPTSSSPYLLVNYPGNGAIKGYHLDSSKPNDIRVIGSIQKAKGRGSKVRRKQGRGSKFRRKQ